MLRPANGAWMLRAVGSITLLGAAGGFLFREWGFVRSVPLHGQLLGLTAALGVVAAACALVLREPKGARTFLAIALYVIPMNFAALGGFTFGAHGGMIDPTRYVSALAAWTIAAGSLALLLPLTFIAFVAVARSRARSLTAALTLTSAVLLVPLRDGAFTAWMLGASVVGLSLYDRFALQRMAVFRTVEGAVARCALFVPVAILVGRFLLYYDPDRAFVVVLLGATSWVLWHLARCTEERSFAVLLQGLSAIVASLACVRLPSVVSTSYPVALVSLPFALALWAMGMSERRARYGLHAVAAMIAALGMLVELLFDPSAATAAVAIVLGAAIGTAAFAARNAGGFIAGAALVLCGCTMQVLRLAELEFFQSWITFAVLGATLIVAASLLERHYGRLRFIVGALVTRFQRHVAKEPRAEVADQPAMPKEMKEWLARK